MKSPKNLLKRLHGGVKLTKYEYEYLLSSYSEFRVGDTIVYNGGIKFHKYSKKFVRRYLGNQDPVVEKLQVGQTYVITNISISPSVNADKSFNFDDPNVILNLEGHENKYSQRFFTMVDPLKSYVCDDKSVSEDFKSLNKQYLTKMMNKCVEEEDYLKAAFYRDEINKLES